MKQIPLNYDWKFIFHWEDEILSKESELNEMETVCIPHTVREIPYHYLDESAYQTVCGYKKVFCASKEWKGQRIFVKFEAVAHYAKVYINGVFVQEHYGGYTAFTVEITDFVNFDQQNEIVVKVDSKESLNCPPFGGSIDYLAYGGIYREVSLLVASKSYLSDVYLQTPPKNNQIQQLIASVTVENSQIEPEIRQYIRSWTKDGLQEFTELKTDSFHKRQGQQSDIYTFYYEVPEAKLWEIDHPYLYEIKTQLFQESVLVDENLQRFGFRTCEFRTDGCYLNDKKIKPIGLNRHQSYPYVGYAMPKRAQQTDADLLKYELKVQAVRTSHYPQSRHFLDRCDEIGLLVFTEIPGWQHIGDETWKSRACNMAKEMVLENRNHPSIVLWGVRINESQDNDEFYTQTNQIVHELDSSRQTSGVRCIAKSNLLEDVYAYNDFIHRGKNIALEKVERVIKKKNAPYLISEHSGHMFPTKSFDWEKKREEHANRHARVLDAFYNNKRISACFGWCMFDYNTHRDFGSGDRICYHGVMDMFRNPKIAAAVYQSQQDKDPVLEISSSMDIGEHPGGFIPYIYAYTNADMVRVYKNGTLVQEAYPDRKHFKAMPHPPILLNDFVGDALETNEKFHKRSAKRIKKVFDDVNQHGMTHVPMRTYLRMGLVMLKERISIPHAMSLYTTYFSNWGSEATTYRFEAIKDGKVVKSITKSEKKAALLQVTTDTTQLYIGDTYDTALIRIEATSEGGERLPYYQEPLRLTQNGAVSIIGPELIALKGGTTGVYVKTNGLKGKGTITITGYGMKAVEVHFIVS